eukprot:299758-Pleurochrysis_carterae.AAC.1
MSLVVQMQAKGLAIMFRLQLGHDAAELLKTDLVHLAFAPQLVEPASQVESRAEVCSPKGARLEKAFDVLYFSGSGLTLGIHTQRFPLLRCSWPRHRSTLLARTYQQLLRALLSSL